ncbi:uncharacterized protein [Miscanthus floridulus]|uniref:uncharacterized protein n=1 Tax=Miscanthus floridulus TaxID=154761 RepID=UPI00345B05EB
MKRLTKVLMDEGSGLNIMYAETLDAIGIDRSHLWPTGAPFHGILREVAKHALKIMLDSKPMKQRLCCFDEEKRRAIDEEIAKLLVAGFIYEVYHSEWLANPVLMTVDTSFQCAYECEVECCEHAAAIITSAELMAIQGKTTKEAPYSKRSAGTFEPIEGVKEVPMEV